MRAKINTLRTYYSKELVKGKQTNKSGDGTEEAYVSKWPFYTSLSFVRDTIRPRKTTSLVSCFNYKIAFAMNRIIGAGQQRKNWMPEIFTCIS